MAGRIRSIKPEWLEDEKLVLASPEARVLSVALLLLADDHGNGRMVSPVLASRIFPRTPGIFAKALDELVGTRFVELYRLDGQSYFSIRTWSKHQKVDKPGKPHVPGPLAEGVEKVIESLAKVPEILATDPDLGPGPVPTTRTRTNDPFPENAISKKSRTGPKTPSAPTAAPVGYTEAVELWFENYKAFYGKAPPWGAKAGRQLKNILASADIEELRELIPQFFHGPYQDSIDAGHPLSDGYACLAKRLDMLRADLTKPERRARASQIRHRLRDAEKQVGVDDELQKALANMAARDEQKQLGDGNGTA